MPIVYSPPIKNKGAIEWTIGALQTLRQVYKDGVMPSMIDDADPDESIHRINLIIKELRRIKKLIP